LPQVLEHLSTEEDEIRSFTALRPHQAHPWHAFLVQIAAMASKRAGADGKGVSAEHWTRWLLTLSGGSEEAWTLLVDDLAQPALLQPPVPEGTLGGFKNRAETPDQIDMLVTAKNHDVKATRMRRATPEHWFYALLTLQTMEGFSGKNNYGIARMNGGFSSRPCVALSPGLRWDERFRRDLGVLLDRYDQTARDHGFALDSGLSLGWLAAWDGTQSLVLGQIDPYVVEVCRRVRLMGGENRNQETTAAISNSQVTRIDAKDTKGDIGDPWTPIDRAEKKAITVQKTGFTYKLTQELLLGGKYEPSASQRVQSEDAGDMLFLASALVRGQGKTEGLHQRALPIPARVRMSLLKAETRDRVSAMAQRRVEIVDTVRQKVLHPALCSLLQGAPNRLDLRDERTRPWKSALDTAVDSLFFEHLWRDMDGGDAERHWQQTVIDLARAQLELALDSVPIPSIRIYRARAAATRVFEGSARKQFPDIFEHDKQTPSEQGAVQ